MKDLAKKRLRFTLSMINFLILIPAVLLGGIFLGDRNYAITATIIVVLAIVPFFLLFENKKMRARELVPIAIMTALAVVSRMAFYAIPQFKPIVAIVIITGVAFGCEAGFLSGSLAMLCSNFLFTQGPWTPWQMFACGLIGYLSGFFGKNKATKQIWLLCIWGLFSGFIYGLFVDTWAMMGFNSSVSWQAAALTYSLGLPFNAILSAATVLTLAFAAKPLLEKLDRIKIKYGLIPAAQCQMPDMSTLKTKSVTGFSSKN